MRRVPLSGVRDRRHNLSSHPGGLIDVISRHFSGVVPDGAADAPQIQQAMAERNRDYQLGGLVELDDAYFRAQSHGPGNAGGHRPRPGHRRGELDIPGAYAYVFLEAVPDLGVATVKELIRRHLEDFGVCKRDVAAVYASAARDHEADHQITLCRDPDTHAVFHWVNIVISNAKTFINGAYHGRVRARRPLYLEEFTYRFNRRFFYTRIAERLLMACVQNAPHPYAA